MLRTARNTIIVVLMIVLSLSLFFNYRGTQHECPTFDTTGFINSLPIEYPDTVYVPTHITNTIIDTVHHFTVQQDTVEIPQDIDSLQIALAYFSTNIAIDTLLNDTNGLIVITDTISRNRIKKRVVSPMVLYPKYKIVTIEKDKDFKPSLWVGAGINGNQHRMGFTVSGLVELKRGLKYGVGYDILNKEIEFSVYKKIF